MLGNAGWGGEPWALVPPPPVSHRCPSPQASGARGQARVTRGAAAAMHAHTRLCTHGKSACTHAGSTHVCGCTRTRHTGMHTHVDTYMHAHIHRHMYADTHVQTHTCGLMQADACTHRHTQTHMDAHMWTHMQTHACTHIHMYADTRRRSWMHTHVRSHTQTYTSTHARAHAAPGIHGARPGTDAGVPRECTGRSPAQGLPGQGPSPASSWGHQALGQLRGHLWPEPVGASPPLPVTPSASQAPALWSPGDWAATGPAWGQPATGGALGCREPRGGSRCRRPRKRP